MKNYKQKIKKLELGLSDRNIAKYFNKFLFLRKSQKEVVGEQ